MAQRFNAPPGWQVPEGFAPPTGWQPDPSWPPAPDGWNFWVDDAAPAGAPAGAPGGPAGFGPGQPGGGYGDPGGYNAAHAPGSANIAVAQKQVKDNKRLMFIGFGIAAAALLIFVVSFGIAASSPTGGTYYRPWYFGLIGLALGIRGAVATSKAKKALAQLNPSAGLAGAYGSGPGSSGPMPPAGGPQAKPSDEGSSSLGDLYR